MNKQLEKLSATQLRAHWLNSPNVHDIFKFSQCPCEVTPVHRWGNQTKQKQNKSQKTKQKPPPPPAKKCAQCCTVSYGVGISTSDSKP